MPTGATVLYIGGSRYSRPKGPAMLRFIIFLSAILWGGLHCKSACAEKIEFNRDVRPILARSCFHCHGPDEAAREADLRLDVADPEVGPFRDLGDGNVISPGDVGSKRTVETRHDGRRGHGDATNGLRHSPIDARPVVHYPAMDRGRCHISDSLGV